MELTDHQRWLQSRQAGIGGSDIAAIIGISRWKTAARVYYDKVQPLDLDGEEETENRMLGRELEQAILNIYEKKTGVTLLRGGLEVSRHPSVEHFVGSYDAVAQPQPIESGADYVVDAKNVDVSQAPFWGASGSSTCPEELAVQLLWYMGIGGFPKGDLAGLIGGRTYRIITIPRADDLIEWLQEEADRFWNEHVIKLNPPPIDLAHRSAPALVKKLHGGIVPTVVNLEPTKYLQMLLREYFTGQVMESVAKKLKSHAKTALQALGAGAQTVNMGEGFKMTQNVRERAGKPYLDTRITAPKNAKPVFEEAARLLEELAANGVDQRLLLAGDIEEEEGEENDE